MKKICTLVILGTMYLTACAGQTFDQDRVRMEEAGRSEDNMEDERDICEAERTGNEDEVINNVTIGGNTIEIKREVIRMDEEIDKRYIEYPYLDSDNDIAQRINDQIYELIDRESLWDSDNTIHEEISYEIMNSDDRILSILFMGYRSVNASYADFDMALNFDMNNGEILTLQSFYTLPEISLLVEAAMEENELLVANIPLEVNEMQYYMNQFFKKVFSDDSYIKRNDNFFIKQGNLYFIAESYPSMRDYIYIEWKNGQAQLTQKVFIE